MSLLIGRAVVEVYIFIFLMYHVWSIDKFHVSLTGQRTDGIRPNIVWWFASVLASQKNLFWWIKKCSDVNDVSNDAVSSVLWYVMLHWTTKRHLNPWLTNGTSNADFETTKIKYTVGFTQIEPGVIISTPYQLWPQNFKDFVPVCWYGCTVCHVYTLNWHCDHAGHGLYGKRNIFTSNRYLLPLAMLLVLSIKLGGEAQFHGKLGV